MKKFYSFFLAAMVGSLAANAQLSLSLNLAGGEQEIKDGATITYSTITDDDGDFFIKPPLFLKSTEEVSNARVTITSDNDLQICGFGSCMIRKDFDEDGIAVGPGTPFDFDMETAMVRSKDDIVKTTINIEVSIPLTPASKRTMTLILDPTASSISGISADADKVGMAGNSLCYNLSAESVIRVYTILGARVIDVAASGNGSIDLSRLPKGIYLYEVIGAKKLSGKFKR